MSDTDTRPLVFPRPVTAALQVPAHHIADRLRGQTTSPLWIAPDLSPELDDVRERLIEFRERVAELIAEHSDLLARHVTEDDEFRAALKDAYRPSSKTQNPPKDTRDLAGRGAELTKIEERLWAAAGAFAETADEARDLLRTQESQLLAAQRAASAAADDNIRDAEAVLALARDEKYRAAMMGRWVQAEADDLGIMSRQAAPTGVRAPRMWTMPTDALERPWHKRREWANAPADVVEDDGLTGQADDVAELHGLAGAA